MKPPAITQNRARKLARQDATAAAKIIAIQEKQIADLSQLKPGCPACQQRAVIDRVDPATGEVSIMLCPNCRHITQAAVDAYLTVNRWS